ncbi:MAG: TIGR00282 family metallophosphoesterase [Spirochaetota bacterium]
MTKQHMKVLFLGDICGRPGSRAVFVGLRQMIKTHGADLVIANGENTTEGFGITPDDADQLFSAGVDVITSGNHIWQREEIRARMDQDHRILRPANYPPGVPGHGSVIIERHGLTAAVMNLQGRDFLPSTDCPFRVGRELALQLRKQTKLLFVDMHAESTQEKEAIGLYLDGLVSVLVGTHTHVQTADERILPGGTGYITDLGMTGAALSVIGSSPELSVRRQLTQMPIKSEIADDAAMINALVATVDSSTGRCLAVERIVNHYGV